MNSTWGTIVGATGIGGLGCFLIWSLYKHWLSLPIFSKIDKWQTFILMIVFLLLVFFVAMVTIYAGWSTNKVLGFDASATKVLDLYVHRSRSGTTQRFPLLKERQPVSSTVTPLLGKDNFRISASFAEPILATAVWVDTRGVSTVVGRSTYSTFLEYPPNDEFVSPDAGDPSGYEAIVLISQPRSQPLTDAQLTHALDGLVPPTQLATNGDDERGPGNLMNTSGSTSFLGFREQARSRLPEGVSLLDIVFVPRIQNHE